LKLSSFLLLLLCLSCSLKAQKIVKLRTLWTKPEVELIFGDYKVYYRIKDINKAMAFLSDADKELYGNTSGLDSTKNYVVELIRGSDMQYLNPLQPLLQNAVGAYLLLSGHARVIDKKGRDIKVLEINTGPSTDMNGFFRLPISFHDPKNGKTVFMGVMDNEMYRKDIGFN
jgi:hypothetical protein